MFWHPQLLQLLSQSVNNDSALMQAAQRFMPVPPMQGVQQQMQAGSQVQNPLSPQQDIGSLLAAAANRDLRKPIRTRSDWQTLGPSLQENQK